MGRWSRIAVVLSGLYALLVASVAYSTRPTLEAAQRLWIGEAAAMISESSKAWVEGVATSPSEKQKLFVGRPGWARGRMAAALVVRWNT